jgi:rhodanese-related sulfurtransferase
MPGIAALGAVLAALEEGRLVPPRETLQAHHARLAEALLQAFPGLVFNAPAELCLPTTLNFSVPGLDAGPLIALFDAAQVRVSGGSACSAAKAQPSHVLQAMGLPPQQAASAVRLSFGPATEPALIDEACERIRACGAALRDSRSTAAAVQAVELSAGEVVDLLRSRASLLVDVRERHEQCGGPMLDPGTAAERQAVPMSDLADALPGWLALPEDTPVVFFCHSGKRSVRAALALRQAGHAQAFSVAGGLSLWPDLATA